MSCFILNKRDMDTVTTITVKLLDYPYFLLQPSTKEVFKDCMIDGKCDPHKVYRKLYISNLMAYNGRYNDENVREFPRFTGLGALFDIKQAFKTVCSYNYQISEAPVDDTPFYWAMRDIAKALSYSIACGDEFEIFYRHR